MEQSLLQIECMSNPNTDQTTTTVNVKLQGDPILVIQGITHAMGAHIQIRAAMITGVLAWCKENNINPDTLKDMVKFH